MTTNHGWQPIETAPRDGTEILLGYAGSHSCAGYWMGDPALNYWNETGWFWTGANVITEHPDSPTHWQPLPPPPEERRDD